jgi:hypothetical protein
MKKEQKELLSSLVRIERKRLFWLLSKVEEDTEDEVRVEMQMDLCTKTLKVLQGGK